MLSNNIVNQKEFKRMETDANGCSQPSVDEYRVIEKALKDKNT
jgi:hypothetical protein